MKDNRPHLKKVERIELDEKNTKGRLILVIVLLLVGFGFIGYGILKNMEVDPGYYTVSVGSGYDINNADEFVLYGYIENSTQQKNIVEIYSTAQVEAYRLFNVNSEYDNNLYYINRHINETIEVDEALYNALKAAADSRLIYLGPIEELYNGIFGCTDDLELGYFDPAMDPEIQLEYDELSTFIQSYDDIHLEFYENNQLKLVVSENYEAKIKECELNNYLDFYWMNNACILDYVCDALTSRNYYEFILSSNDGFARNMSSTANGSTAVYDVLNGEVIVAGYFDYTGPLTMVNLRNLILSESDEFNYYQSKDGKLYSKYLNLQGQNVQNFSSLLTMSEQSCLQLALTGFNFYLNQSGEIDYIYCENGNIYTNTELQFYNVYDDYLVVRKK